MTGHAYGHIAPTPDPRDRAFKAARPYTGVFVDLSDRFPELPYDQQSLGSCVSQGTAATLDLIRVSSGLPAVRRPSRLFIYWNGRALGKYPADQDTGLQIRDGIKAVAKFGAPPEDSFWPYVISQFKVQPPQAAFEAGAHDAALAYGSVSQGSDIDAAISAGHPVVFGFTVYESFESDAVARSGVMPVPKAGEKNLGGHCVVAVSTVKDGSEILGGVPGVKYRKCRNSWGTSWGVGGYFWMPAAYMDSSEASDFWVITSAGDPNAPQPNPQPQDADKALADAFAAWVKRPHAYKPLIAALWAWARTKGFVA